MNTKEQREHHKLYCRMWRVKNRDRHLAIQRRIQEKRKASGYAECKKWRASEKGQESMLRYRTENKEKISERQREYRKLNPLKCLYSGIKKRCENPKNHAWKYYGGKGVKCLISLEELKFLWDRDNAASMKIPSIDRVDSDGNYEISNCRFIEKTENSGRAHRGELSRNSKLKKEDVFEIFDLRKKGVFVSNIAQKYGISQSHCGGILRGKYWKHLRSETNGLL